VLKVIFVRILKGIITTLWYSFVGNLTMLMEENTLRCLFKKWEQIETFKNNGSKLNNLKNGWTK